MEADELTPVMQDYLKVIWSAVEWGDPPITTTGLADRFGTSRANVSDVMRRLHGHGLVDYEPYRPVTLTALGERLALAMVRRHRLIECFLADVLGYSWDEVHDDAERLEHAASDRFLDRIDALLGHPTADPHGDPIPTPDGRRPAPPGAIALPDAAPGPHRVVRVSDADPAVLARLEALGVRPGSMLTVRPDGGYADAAGDPLDLGAAERDVRVLPPQD
ncbi:metal-dependent transcriptional regulator [Propioniciclava coleopterorum]|uniref:Manganese transport regulator n=1 Tax=Propioniciclava coleopterorum TaxID=2714937 RepID=A0A6G7Y701_9ACTN|nr:metal-dependent transcriptional regulator [Propioniciclava coleopterorum]QIK72592.1 metal-dependent transcriptional regulator [Propioniciclava coleopterorum]